VDKITKTSPVTLTFATVSQPGFTSLVSSPAGPNPPTGFQLGNPGVYYNWATTATYSGVISVCINFSSINFGSSPVALYHFENNAWVDVTASLDPVNQIICGNVTSLSPFAVFQPVQNFATTMTINAPGVTYGNPSSVAVTVTSAGGTVTGSVTLSLDGGPASIVPLSSGLGIFNLGILSAGSHSLSASFPGQGTFSASGASGTLSVAPAPLTIVANSVARPYGTNNPALTGTVTGLVNSDFVTATFVTTATPASPVGSYGIVPTVIGAPNILANYSVALVNGTLSVVPAASSLTVTFAPTSIPVGQSTTATLTLTAPGMVIPIDPSVLAPITLTSPVASDILSNGGVCTLVPSATPGTAGCTVTVTSVEPNGRTLNASFAGSPALLASSGAGDLIVTAALQSQNVCIRSDFRNVAVAGGNTIWFNSIFKVRDLDGPKQKVNISFFNSSFQFQYKDASGNLVSVNQAMPDARILIDPSVSVASTSFDSANNVWITTIPWDLDDNTFLTGIPWTVPSGGLPADVEPVTVCGTFASDVANLDIGWRWGAAAYSSFSTDNSVLGVKPMDSDHDNPGTPGSNHDRAGTPENFKQFVIPGARSRGGSNFTGSYSGAAEIE
jgi:hypothetical protein